MNTGKYILSDNAKKIIQDEIKQYEGNEIFFGCLIDNNNFVTEVKAFCYGNEEAVLAPYEIAKIYHAVLHNHPSGNIKPSADDINYAQYLQNEGIGFFITDNEASKLNCVVPPIILFKNNEKIDYELIKDFFSTDGIIAKNKEGYEVREGQLDMSLSVAESLNDNKIALIEAGTGIGKSLAYLIPVFLWAEKNNERIVISTNTINLQNQLINKDIPFVKKILNSNLDAVIVKGRRNYLCKLKIYNVQSELELDEQAEELNTILKWAAITNEGVIDELNFEPSNDTWEKVSSEVDFCAGKNCSFYTGCFFQIARKKASDSNILIVNHHILFADVDIRSQGRGLDENILLPPYKKIIFDEAHNIVKSASSFFSISFSKGSFYKFLSLFKKKNKGILNRLLNKFHSGRKKGLTSVAEYLENNVISSFNELYDKTYEVFQNINRYFAKICKNQDDNYNLYKTNLQYRIKKTEWESESFNEEVINCLKSLLIALDRFDGFLELFLKKFNELKDTVKQKYELDIKLLKSYLMKLSSVQESINGLINIDTDYYVTWFEMFGDLADPLFKINATPLEIEKKLYENIYEVFDSIVLCSATLTVSSSFNYFKRLSGLSLASDREIIQKKIDSPFDYQSKVLFVVPVDMPEPADPDYNEKLNNF
jgi:ATP-dependent DNA helicase DinG